MRNWISYALKSSICFAIVSCGGSNAITYNEHSAIAGRNYSGAITLIEEKIGDRGYKDKDQVTYLLDLGTAAHFGQDFQKSNQFFTEAEQAIDANFTKRIGRAIGSMLINDNTLAYDGEVYEDIYINAFKAVNYLKLSDLEAAQVEARRMVFKLDNNLIKAGKFADQLNNDTDEKVISFKAIAEEMGFKTSPETMGIQDSPFSHYLSALVFTKQGKFDNARIEEKRMNDALENHDQTFESSFKDEVSKQELLNANKYNTLLVAFSGRGPIKYEVKREYYDRKKDLIIIYAYANIKKRPSWVSSVEVWVDGEKTGELPVVEDFSNVAYEVFKAKLPAIKYRAYVRGINKAEIQKDLAESDDNSASGILASSISGGIGRAYQRGTEKADLRAWDSMPGRVHGLVLNLSPGEHDLEWRFLTKDGRMLMTKTETVEISENAPINTFSTQYWN